MHDLASRRLGTPAFDQTSEATGQTLRSVKGVRPYFIRPSRVREESISRAIQVERQLSKANSDRIYSAGYQHRAKLHCGAFRFLFGDQLDRRFHVGCVRGILRGEGCSFLELLQCFFRVVLLQEEHSNIVVHLRRIRF